MSRPTDPTDPSLGFYIPNLSVGGAEQVAVNIVNGLAKRGYDVELVLSHPGGELRSQLLPEVPVIELASTRVPVAGIGAHIPRIVSYLEDREPTALIAHMLHSGTVCLAAGRLADSETTVVPTQHIAIGPTSGRSVKSKALRRLAKRLYPSASRIIAVSQGVSDSLVEHMDVPPEAVSVLHNPVEVDDIRRRARDPVDHEWIEDDTLEVVLFVGRHQSQKALDTWLRAFDRVHESDPDTRAIVAGTGTLTPDLRDLADELGISDVVSFPGYVDNPFGYMACASVFLLSSRYEGLPTVLIEAMACGCPVVATDCPSGPREIFVDGEYGPLPAVGDVDGIAAAVRETLADPVDPDVLRRRADDFAPAAVFDDYEEFIRTKLQ
jgi:glycosyltransferase involved in cell wall biosynthesis